MCLFRVPDRPNALLHTWHLYGLSPLWILLCVTRCWACVNRLLQTVHWNGFSPEWLRLCAARARLLWQHLPHSVHLYLPLWIFICWHRPLWHKKRFSHWSHEYKFSPVCLFLWWLKLSLCVNRLSNTVHKYDVGLSSCGCSVTSSLLSASVFILNDLSPVQYTQHNIYQNWYSTALHCAWHTSTMVVKHCHCWHYYWQWRRWSFIHSFLTCITRCALCIAQTSVSRVDAGNDNIGEFVQTQYLQSNWFRNRKLIQANCRWMNITVCVVALHCCKGDERFQWEMPFLSGSSSSSPWTHEPIFENICTTD